MEEKKLSDFNFDFEALVSCPFCSSQVMIPNGRVKWYSFDFWYVFCPSCGLKYMNPRPTIQSYKDFYKKFFWEQKITNTGFHQEGQMWGLDKYKFDNEKIWDAKDGKKNRIEKQKAQRIKTIIPVIEKSISINSNSDILEIGCGFGVTLNELSLKYNCKSYGIEPSEEARKTILEYGKINLIGYYAEEIEEISTKDIKFDVIIFSHSLENTVDPINIIKYAKLCLKNSGIIYIQTPNLLTFDQMNPYHPFIFSQNSVLHLAEKNNLNCSIESETIDKMLVTVFKN